MKNAKFCPHCGAELAAGVKFCPKCGYQLTDTAASQANATQATTETDKTTQPAQPAQSTEDATGNGSFSERLDAMVNWVTNNWATAIIIVAALLVFTLVTRAMFYNIWLGAIALVAVLAWLYSMAWTNGSAATAFEQKLRHTAKQTATTVNNKVNAPTKQTNETTGSASQASQPVQSAVQPQMQQASVNPQATTAGQQAAQPSNQSGNTVYIQQSQQQSNGLGTAGFVLALIALITSVIPFVDWVIWFLGALFSFIGLFRQPRGLAIAGLIISFIGVIIILTLAVTIAGMLGIMM